ncbi:MAG: P1 family peptidase, partial [Ilumatobacteraceae bacterium]
VVGETYDGFLNDIDGFHLEPSHVRAALADADRTRGADEPAVEEGNVGGGTGMVCHQFKGGIGTSSRRAGEPGSPDGEFTVGALVQANYGRRSLLRFDGTRIGHLVDENAVPLPSEPHVPEAGSVIVLVATDAPLLADQCQRLAQRATIGLARVGSIAADSSGDIVLAWSSANAVPEDAAASFAIRSLPHGHLTPLFEAVAEAVEEAVWNALVAATTMVGQRGRVVHAIPHDLLRSAAATASAGFT